MLKRPAFFLDAQICTGWKTSPSNLILSVSFMKLHLSVLRVSLPLLMVKMKLQRKKKLTRFLETAPQQLKISNSP